MVHVNHGEIITPPFARRADHELRCVIMLASGH
jgi:hypothetical protein